jgi:hypothetical protein
MTEIYPGYATRDEEVIRLHRKCSPRCNSMIECRGSKDNDMSRGVSRKNKIKFKRGGRKKKRTLV